MTTDYGLSILQQALNNTPNDEYLQQLLKHFDVFVDIYKATNYTFFDGCGSYLFGGRAYEYSNETADKARELYYATKNKKTALEIGVYMGHSQLIMLLANNELEIHSIDIDSTYSGPAIEVLKRHFPLAKLNFIVGPSLEHLQNVISSKDNWDVIHIDGDHNIEVVKKEWEICKPVLKEGNILIFDDVWIGEQWFRQIGSQYAKRYHIPSCNWANIVMYF